MAGFGGFGPAQGIIATAVVDNGTPVAGGTANGVLYVNSSGNLDSGSVFSFDGTNVTLASGQLILPGGGAATPTLRLNADQSGIYSSGAGTIDIALATSRQFAMQTNAFYMLGTAPQILMGASSDVRLAYDAAGILAQRNGTNAQVFRVYNTYTSDSVKEYFEIDWTTSANVCYLRTSHAGASARTLRIGYGASSNIAFSIPTTVGATPIQISQGTGANSAVAGAIWMQLGSSAVMTATSGSNYGFRITGSPAPTAQSTMIWHGLALEPTINFQNGTPGAGQIKMLYLNPTNTALPTGLNAAHVFSSTASTLGGQIFHNQTDEATNYEIARHRYLSNDYVIESTAAGSGTPRFIGLGLAGFGAVLKYKYATTTLSNVSGATVTATNLIPAKSNVVAVITRVTDTLTGASGYTVGDGSDADRWGDVTGTAIGTDTDQSDATADPTGWFTAANNVVLTAKTSNFTDGDIRVTVIYLDMVAATS